MEAKTINTIDLDEVERFSRIADEWWDLEGKFKPLHRINPLRITYIRDAVAAHFGRDAEAAQPMAGLRLLDIGCGGGLICEPMSRLGAAVTGIDASEKNIKVATLHAEKSGVSVHYRAMPAEHLVAEGAQFDVVLALEIVEHVADVAAFVQAASALVKPGGMMVWSTMNRTPKAWALAIVGAEYVLRWLPKGTHDWKKFVKPSELTGHLRRHALRVTHLTGMVMNPLNFQWRLEERDVAVNYLLVATKEA